MATKKYTKITTRTLKHVLEWGKACCKNDSWTKSDANTYALIEHEVKRLLHEEYLKKKTIKANPYLDPDQPYHTT